MDLGSFTDENTANEEMDKMDIIFMERAKASPAFLNRILGLVDEAVERKII